MRSVLAALALGVAGVSAAPHAAAQTGELENWISIGDMAAASLDRHLSSRQFAQDLMDTGSFDPEMNEYFRHSIESMDRQVARDRELIRISNEAVAIETGSASDPKANAVNGPLQDWLANESKRTAGSGPINEWIAAHEARMARDSAQAARLDGSSNSATGRAFNEARAAQSWSAVQSSRVLQQFATIVVDSTGDVIVNDPRDAVEAKLIDIDAELEQLQEQAREENDIEAQKAIRSRIAALDRELRNTISALSRMVETIDAPAHKPVRRDPPVCSAPNQNTVSLGCEYWADGMPLVIPGGDPIIIDKIELDIADDRLGRPLSWRLDFYWHYRSDPGRSEEPATSANGDIEVDADGNLYLAPGSESAGVGASSFKLSIDRMTARAIGVDVLDGNHPLSLTLSRDPGNFVDRSAVASVPGQRSADDVEVLPLEEREPEDDLEVLPLEERNTGPLDDVDVLALEERAPETSQGEELEVLPLDEGQNGDDLELAPLDRQTAASPGPRRESRPQRPTP
jgi:hypothetical protein